MPGEPDVARRALAAPVLGAYRYLVMPEGDEDAERLVRIRVKMPDGAREGDLRRELGDSTPCDWQPDILTYAPMRIGARWSNNSRCTYTTEDQQTKVHLVSESTVTGARRSRVADDEVDVWVIESSVTIESEGPLGDQGDDFEATEVRELMSLGPR